MQEWRLPTLRIKSRVNIFKKKTFVKYYSNKKWLNFSFKLYQFAYTYLFLSLVNVLHCVCHPVWLEKNLLYKLSYLKPQIQSKKTS